MYLTLILLPLIGSIYSGLYGRKIGTKGSQLMTTTLVIITTILAIIIYIEVGLNNIPVSIKLFRWLDSESLNIWWGFYFDSLTVLCVNSINSKIWILAVLVEIQLCKFILKTAITVCVAIILQIFKLINYCIYLISNIRFIKRLNTLNLNKIWLRNFTLSQDKDEKFLQWFVGFADAESCFSINKLINKDNSSISKFTFMFKIGLHIDDLKVLKLIQEKLGIGKVRIYKNECIFNITDKNGIEKLIQIFDKYNLNTTKYLDYIDFKKAFNLYNNRNKNLSLDLVIENIFELKEKMNNSRVNYERSTEIRINKYWLLGFIEGDGSFFIRRKPLVPTFSIELSAIQLPVILKIKEYLENNLNFDSYSKYKLINSSIISILQVDSRERGKPSVSLVIQNLRVLHNYLIPFLGDMEFLSKKGLDFSDFKVICYAIYNGIHRIEEMKELILKLSYNMNNYRLSTNTKLIEILSNEDRDKLINTNSTVKYLSDGRQIDIITNKVLFQQTSCIYEICTPNNEIILINSLQEASLIIGVHSETLSKHLESAYLRSILSIELKNYKVRRIAVFN
jgi:hypothetical protein